jgi:hypothetical protein
VVCKVVDIFMKRMTSLILILRQSVALCNEFIVLVLYLYCDIFVLLLYFLVLSVWSFVLVLLLLLFLCCI